MGSISHTKEVIYEILRLLKAATLYGTLGLKSVNVGDISFLPAPHLLNQVVPTIYVKMFPFTEYETRNLHADYTETDNLRLIYVFPWEDGQDVITKKLDDGKVILDELKDNFGLGELTMDNGQTLDTRIELVEWEPMEDKFVTTIEKAQLAAIAIQWTVRVLTDRN